MNIQEYDERMKKIQDNLINYIDDQDNVEENYQNLINLLEDYQILTNHEDLRTLLHLLSKVSNHHHRFSNFFDKIERIFEKIKNEINFSNSELYKFFKNNKRLLLFLIEEKLITINKTIALNMFQTKLKNQNYPEYFSSEIKTFINEEFKQELNQNSENDDLINRICEDLPQDFNEKRKIGENDTIICQLIQKDQIDEFIEFLNNENISPKSTIDRSIYETNPFLLKNENITLIEYAAFNGSIQIFNHLSKSEIELTSSLWLYSIHGHNLEIIQFLENNKIEPPQNLYQECLNESIKCHHNQIANYIKEKYLNDNPKKVNINNFLNFNKSIQIRDSIESSFRYFNFAFFPDEMKNAQILGYACKYDHFTVVKYILKLGKIDVNAIIILKNQLFF